MTTTSAALRRASRSHFRWFVPYPSFSQCWKTRMTTSPATSTVQSGDWRRQPGGLRPSPTWRWRLKSVQLPARHDTRAERRPFVRGSQARQVRFVSAPNDRFRLRNWWRSEDGFCIVIGEYIKLAGYWVRYGRFRYWAVGAIILFGAAIVAWRHNRKRTNAGTSEIIAPASRDRMAVLPVGHAKEANRVDRQVGSTFEHEAIQHSL